MIKKVTLSEKQMIAIELLMRSLPVAEVAKKAGVSRITIYRWLKSETFNAELTKRKHDLIEGVSRKLSGAMDQAVNVLIDLLKSKNQNVRRLSAGNLIDYCMKFSNFTDIEDRIKALESAIDKK